MMMMEEEVGIKGTRLRRRLSIEADDVKSPSTQSTPTKKRGGRLAAKPQLELIDENVPELVTNKTTKARDIAAEEKVLTPSRRSSRIRSNTSILSETLEVEEKSTPARRTTRVKSNTSLVAEAVTSVTTPRAKRAARRNSQVGSDNEAPVTPVRQTRRTRKDSTSSVDKTADKPDKGSQIKEVIVEETENTDKDNNNETSSKKESPIRKSPRLSEKALSKISSSQPVVQIEKMDLTNKLDKSKMEAKDEQTTKAVEEEKSSEKSNLSITSSNLIKALDDAPKRGKNDVNKSTNALYDEPLPKARRNRTKSWTTISVEPTNDNNFCSDSEVFKKDNKKKNNSLNTSNISGSGDGIMNTSKKVNENEDVNSSVLSDKKNKKRQEKSMVMDNETSEHEPPIVNASPKLIKATEIKSEDTSTSQDGKSLNSSKQFDSNGTEKLFEQAPAGLIQSLVYIEDSDSNHGSISKGNTEKDFDSGDQCVPVVDHDLGANETTKEATNNLSYEPMDVDETLPENISLSTFAQKNNSIKPDDQGNESQKRKSTLNMSKIKDDSLLNSKRKSSISNLISEDTLDGTPQLSSRKSLEKSTVKDDSLTKKTKRNSSIFNVSTVDNIEVEVNITKRNSLTSGDVKDESMDENSDKSKRKSKSPMVSKENIKNSSTTSATALVFDENMDKSLTKSKRQSSVSALVYETMDKRKSSNSNSVIDEDNLNKSSDKSNGKTSILKEVNDETVDKNLSKSSRKSSLLQETENHDKTDNNDSKSTLVLSQIKDLSESELNVETNVPKKNNESNSPLSKSVTVPNVTLDKETDKKDLSLTYLTSTPLQQKSFKKLGMQINSSIITPSSTTKIQKDNATRNTTKEASIISQEESDSSEEEEDDSEEESSLENSNMINDEAEEASADYESGDSRDEDEKEYEEQHEIVEKGETLDSDDEHEYSEDDYEKDSFIVSSDEEDNDLLSGSGDDLELSDNELTMSTKSKIKYNERKSKEQKKASKEMFEARHQLEKPDKTGKSKSKKNNRQRLDSTSSESDNEVTAQPKNKRRQRIDSSQELSNVQSDADKSLSKKKIARRMSVSICEENEKVTTVCEEPESEPKNKRRQRIDSSQDMSNVQSDAEKSLSKKKSARRTSVSICKDNIKEVTICEDTESEPNNKRHQKIDSSQDISNVQSDADKTLSSKKKKIARGMSVSISEDKETNEKEITIREDAEADTVDPLALQNVIKVEPKTPQKDFDISTVAVTTVDEAEEVNVDENVTILEFNQTSDPLQTTTHNGDSEEDDENEDSISENEEITENYESMLNNLNKISSMKNKSQDISLNLDKKPKQKKPKDPIVDQLNLTQVKKSKKKQSTSVEDEPKILEKGKNTEKDKQVFVFSEGSSDSIDMRLLFPEDSNDSESIVVAKGTKNEQAKEEENVEVIDDFIPLKRTEGKTNILENAETENNSMDESVLNVSSKKKKNKRKSAQAAESEDMIDQETNLNFFIDTTGNLTDSHKTEANTSVKSSAKKNKQKNNVSFVNIEEDKLDNDADDAPLEVSYQSNKNSTRIEEENTATETPNQSAKKKKKNKKALNNSHVEELNLFGKKDNVAENSNNSIIDGSAKKKKKLSESQVAQETENDTVIPVHDVSISSSKKQKQRTVSQSCEVVTETEGDYDVNNEDTSKKRKRKSSANQTIEEIIIKDDLKPDTSTTLNDSTVNKKKKRKISHNNDESEKSDVQEIVKESQEKTEVKNAKKKNKLVQNQAVNEIDEGATKKNKKRKERDDDDLTKISKVPKQNSLDKVHVPRLPANVLQQLDDKPKREIIIPKAISTTSFVVEQTKKRKTKPSNYLEESVYLNDSVEEKKQKGSVKNLKVLPFIPTASTSGYGFTTNFRVNVIPQQTQFVAQSSGTDNFKNDYLTKKRIKKLGTFEKFKRQRSVKLSKF